MTLWGWDNDKYMCDSLFFLCFGDHGSMRYCRTKVSLLPNHTGGQLLRTFAQIHDWIQVRKIGLYCIKPLRFWCRLFLQHHLAYTAWHTFSSILKLYSLRSCAFLARSLSFVLAIINEIFFPSCIFSNGLWFIYRKAINVYILNL